MAMTTGLPPQAYTREILVQAFEWWSMQAPALKERATTADAIVSFYLQARRRGAAHPDTPLSGEVFKNDLKTLAEGLKQFEDSVAPPPQPLRSFAPPVTPPVQHAPAPPLATPLPPTAAPVPPTAAAGVVVWSVDARSVQAAKEIQLRLNLGSEIEALRMLVTLGIERSRELFLTERAPL
jgi:hypothetical protein